MFGNKKEIERIDEGIGELFNQIENMQTEIKYLKERKELSNEIGGRVAELELKMAKLWNMLLETTPTGKEKLSKFGRRFGGRSKLDNR